MNSITVKTHYGGISSSRILSCPLHHVYHSPLLIRTTSARLCSAGAWRPETAASVPAVACSQTELRKAPAMARPPAGALLSVLLGPPDPLPSQRPDILSSPLSPFPRVQSDSIFSDLPPLPQPRAPKWASGSLPFQSCAPSEQPGPEEMTAGVTFPKPKARAGAVQRGLSHS